MKNTDSLTRRAGLTLINQIVLQGARFIVGFVVTPIIIRGLGAELYGAWVMIRQSVGYLALSDLKPMSTLKFTLGVRQHRDDMQEKRRLIGSALLTWAFTFPFFLILGGLTIWKLPSFIRVGSAYVNQAQLAIVIVVLSMIMERVLSLPANVLRGMNLEYKAMGLKAAIILLNGGLIALAIWMGWGLPGVAGASVLGIIISGLIRLFVARSAFPWFGVSKPKKREFVEFAKLSAWLTFSGLSGTFLRASDLLLVGFLLGPASAAVYATTGAILRMTTQPLAQILSSANPGLVGICGQGDWKRVMKVRAEMFSFAMACMVFLGAGILALNKTFVSLWVGQEYFGGQVTNLFLVLAAVSRLFFRIDTIIIGGMLELKRMALSMFVCGVVVLAFGVGLISIWGLPGMACATLIGYVLQWVYYQSIIEKRFGLSLRPFFIQLIRPIFTAVSIFFISYLSSYFINLKGWIGFFSIVILFSFVISCYVWFLTMSSSNRNDVVFRVRSFIC